jgi:TolB-like protein
MDRDVSLRNALESCPPLTLEPAMPVRLALVAFIALGLLAGPGSAEPAADDGPAGPAVAVLYFDYAGKTEGLDVLRKGLAQMLITDLAERTHAALVERDRLQEVLAELDLARSGRIDKATAARVGKLLGARVLVMGGYFDMGGALRVDARIVDVETGRIIDSIGASGQADDFLAIERELADEIASVLARVPAERPKAKRPKRPSKPKTTQAQAKLTVDQAAAYSKALDAADRGDMIEAKAALEKVIAEVPDFQLARSDLDALLQ